MVIHGVRTPLREETRKNRSDRLRHSLADRKLRLNSGEKTAGVVSFDDARVIFQSRYQLSAQPSRYLRFNSASESATFVTFMFAPS